MKSEIGKQICRPKNVHKVILKRAKMEYLEKVRIASSKIHSKNCALSEFWNFLPQIFSFISFFLCSAYSFAHMKNTKKNHIFLWEKIFWICETFKENSTLRTQICSWMCFIGQLVMEILEILPQNSYLWGLARPNCCACSQSKKLLGFFTRNFL